MIKKVDPNSGHLDNISEKLINVPIEIMKKQYTKYGCTSIATTLFSMYNHIQAHYSLLYRKFLVCKKKNNSATDEKKNQAWWIFSKDSFLTKCAIWILSLN